MIHSVRPVRTNLHFEDRVRAASANAFDSEADVGQVFGETVVVHREINEVANPIGKKFHGKGSVIARMTNMFMPTAARTARPPERTAGCRPPHISVTLTGLRPCRRRIRKLF